MSVLNQISRLTSTLAQASPLKEVTSNTAGSTANLSVAQDTQQAHDATTLSTTGGLMAEALSGSDVRETKVAALRQSIADGSYSVPSSEVAGKILDSMLS